MGEGEIGWRNPCFASVALLTETPTAPVLMKIQVKTISGQVDSLEVAEDCTARGSFFFRLGWPPLSHRVRAWDGTSFGSKVFLPGPSMPPLKNGDWFLWIKYCRCVDGRGI